jgi:hypothetical protein
VDAGVAQAVNQVRKHLQESLGVAERDRHRPFASPAPVAVRNDREVTDAVVVQPVGFDFASNPLRHDLLFPH